MSVRAILFVSFALAACQNPPSTEESDPLFAASPAAQITSADTEAWDEAAARDYSDAGFLTSEEDPLFAASVAASVTAEQVGAWNQSSAWGDHAAVGYLTSETDPGFAASAAASVTAMQLASWDQAFAWGNHAAAGYLTSETDPGFAASAAASVTATQLAAWDQAYAWGDHAASGYLTTESDPVFNASEAKNVTSAKLGNWDQAYGWGNHASAGYLKTESDPKVGALTTGAIPRWSGSALANSALTQSGALVGVSSTAPDALLTVGAVASFGKNLPTNISKTCAVGSGYMWTHTVPSRPACTSYCTGQGFDVGVVSTQGAPSFCAGAQCAYVSNYSTCATTVTSNSGCDSCASNFVCTCLITGSVFNSEVRVDAYLRLGNTVGQPPAADCGTASAQGRMKVDTISGLLWVCTSSGWTSK